MNDKHTPGPWPVRDELITSIGQGASVCRMMTANQGWQANARLIAAPELLVTLQTITEYVGHLSARDSAIAIPYQRAINAIAKARGE